MSDELKRERIRIGESEIGKSQQIEADLLRLLKERGDEPIVLDPRIPDDEDESETEA